METRITIDIPAATLAEWTTLTESNAHGEALEAVCKYIGKQSGLYVVGGVFAQWGRDLARINRMHRRAGFLTETLYESRKAIYSEMVRFFGEYFHPAVAAAIMECL